MYRSSEMSGILKQKDKNNRYHKSFSMTFVSSNYDIDMPIRHTGMYLAFTWMYQALD